MDEELLSRQQPQSLEAEQAVLGSVSYTHLTLPTKLEV